MIAVDTNILIYAHRRESPWHARAAGSVRRLAESSRWAIPWPCLHEFYGIATHPRVLHPPSTPAEAVDQIAAWRESPGLTLLAEDAGYWPHFRHLQVATAIVGPAVHDLRIAALCLAHGIDELWSADRDFSRVPRLRVRNPLVS